MSVNSHTIGKLTGHELAVTRNLPTNNDTLDQASSTTNDNVVTVAEDAIDWIDTDMDQTV